jgi:hypothetical protein
VLPERVVAFQFDVVFTHEVAPEEVQVSVELLPAVIVLGLAVSVTVGGGLAAMLTVTESVAVPPEPVQLME